MSELYIAIQIIRLILTVLWFIISTIIRVVWFIISLIFPFLRLHITPKRFALFDKMWSVPFGENFQSGFGERMTYKKVRGARPFWFGAKFLRNLYIPIGYHDTLEVDLVVISKKVVYIYLTKNIVGTIYGNENDRYWTVQTADGSYRISNPIRQARLITRRLKEIVGVKRSVYPNIIFPNGANLENLVYTPNTCDQTVIIHTGDIRRNAAHNWKNWKKNYFDRDDIERIYQALAPYQKGRNPQKASAQRKTA